MFDVIKSAKPGDKLKVVFADKTFDGDLKGLLYMILMMNGQSIELDDLPMHNLKAVADSGEWQGFRTYTITLLDAFDPEHFIGRTIVREMLESVSLEKQ